MGEQRYEKVAAQPAEQVRQMLPISPTAGNHCFAHSVQHFQKMGVDTARRVGTNPEMLGDAFDQQCMKRPDLRIVQAPFQCAKLAGCTCRTNIRNNARRSCPALERPCSLGASSPIRSSMRLSQARVTSPCPAACRAMSRRIERSSRARLRPASAVWNSCMLHSATVVPMNNATLLLSAPTMLTVLVAPSPR